MKVKDYDFSGWATKNDIQCADGRTIRRDAFKNNDGMRVPLVYNHDHNDPLNVLGHADLINKPEGVYMYGKFNNTEAGRHAKESVINGDITNLSIYANHLKQTASGDVLHGMIREVSLVLAGANPGAYIDNVIIHGEDSGTEAIIYTDDIIELMHSDDNEDTESDKKKKPEDGSSEKKDSDKKEETEEKEVADTGEKTVKEILDTLNPEQEAAVAYIIKELTGEDIDDTEDTEDEGEEENMKHNIFSNETDNVDVLSHSDMEAIFADAKRSGSLKEAVLEHTDNYGIANIDYLFPDAKTVTPTPEFIKRDTDWVDTVMNGVSRSPFSRIKSIFANITEDQARAKGYIKGKLKKEEVFSLLKRATTPQTIYKKQKLDRDDIIDITDFDVVAWIKSEMRLMLDEEIARAILIGDGRLISDDDHISEEHIRPIYKDSDLYTIKAVVQVARGATDSVKAAAFIKSAIKARKDYKGSGTPALYTTEDMLTSCLLLEDGIGRPLYPTVEALATKLRVSKIITVPVMENITDTNGKLEGIIVNLKDYRVGADKGGAINMFDNFDIDYNQQKYLIETRCSGALTVPYSAIAMYIAESGNVNPLKAVTVNPENGNSELFGTLVSDMQTNIDVQSNAISGTLKYISEGALVDTWGAGNFLALKFTDLDPDATSVKVGLEPSMGSGLVEIINDPDKNGVFKVTNTAQKFKIVSTDGNNTKTQLFDLGSLELMPEAEG